MWVVPATIVILGAVILFMPKRLTWKEMYLIWGVIGLWAFIADHLVGSIWNLFDIGPTPEPTYIDIFAVSFIPAEFAILFLNFRPKEGRAWVYGLVWSAATFLYEWLVTYTGYLKDKGWSPWYSIPAWLFVYLFFLNWNLKLIRRSST